MRANDARRTPSGNAPIGLLDAADRFGRTCVGPRRTMLVGVGASALVLVALVVLGSEGSALAIAAGVLLVACLGACGWAWIAYYRASRRFAEAVERLARERTEQEVRRKGA